MGVIISSTLNKMGEIFFSSKLGIRRVYSGKFNVESKSISQYIWLWQSSCRVKTWAEPNNLGEGDRATENTSQCSASSFLGFVMPVLAASINLGPPFCKTVKVRSDSFRLLGATTLKNPTAIFHKTRSHRTILTPPLVAVTVLAPVLYIM